MAIEYHLILINQRGCQAPSDFHQIAAYVSEMAPDIETFVVDNNNTQSVTRKRAGKRPSLIFSPGPIDRFKPLRGRVYAGSYISKLEQMRALSAAGVPVPDFIELGSGSDVASLGEVVLFKPDGMNASRGRGVELRRADALASENNQTNSSSFAQRFINSGPFPQNYRVHTLFGEPLFAYNKLSHIELGDLNAPDEIVRTYPVVPSNKIGQTITPCYDEDVLALVRRCYQALPEVPLQGCDIVRDATTGALFVLEVNPGGNTWVFSKERSRKAISDALVAAMGGDLTKQFDAFRTAASVLIEKTRNDAQ